MSNRKIDLNADLGEWDSLDQSGSDRALLDVISSANISCGAHAGGDLAMQTTLQWAAEKGVCIGAHPGYADRENFGRKIVPMTMGELDQLLTVQIDAFRTCAQVENVSVAYVKLHGALANLAASDREVAQRVTKTIRSIDQNLAILAISGTILHHIAQNKGIVTYAEIFADRGYLASGQLAPRGMPGAVIDDSDFAVERMCNFLDTGYMPTLDGDPITLEAQSICLHGDGPSALRMSMQLRDQLCEQNIEIMPFIAPISGAHA